MLLTFSAAAECVPKTAGLLNEHIVLRMLPCRLSPANVCLSFIAWICLYQVSCVFVLNSLCSWVTFHMVQRLLRRQFFSYVVTLGNEAALDLSDVPCDIFCRIKSIPNLIKLKSSSV